MACERCAGAIPTAVYRLHKGGGTRRVNLCNPCRDVTALVHALEAVEPKPTRRRPGRRPKRSKAPEAKEPEVEPELEPEPAEPTESEAGVEPRGDSAIS